MHIPSPDLGTRNAEPGMNQPQSNSVKLRQGHFFSRSRPIRLFKFKVSKFEVQGSKFEPKRFFHASPKPNSEPGTRNPERLSTINSPSINQAQSNQKTGPVKPGQAWSRLKYSLRGQSPPTLWSMKRTAAPAFPAFAHFPFSVLRICFGFWISILDFGFHASRFIFHASHTCRAGVGRRRVTFHALPGPLSRKNRQSPAKSFKENRRKSALCLEN